MYLTPIRFECLQLLSFVFTNSNFRTLALTSPNVLKVVLKTVIKYFKYSFDHLITLYHVVFGIIQTYSCTMNRAVIVISNLFATATFKNLVSINHPFVIAISHQFAVQCGVNLLLNDYPTY